MPVRAKKQEGVMDWKDYVNKPYNIELKDNAEVLDQIDLLGYCKTGRSVADIMDKVEGQLPTA